MPPLWWNLHTNFSSPLCGNVTCVSVSSPGWISLSTLCSESVKVCATLPLFLSSSSTI